MVDEALRRTGKSSVFEAYESVPEYSAVGASPSKGRAERAVQTNEDQLRTLKSAFERRIDTSPVRPSSHAMAGRACSQPFESLQGPW